MYLLRLEKKAISENSILKHDQALRFFRSIPNSYSPEELKIDLFCNYIPHERGYAKGVEEGVLIYFNL